MAEYIFLPSGCRVSSAATLGAPLYAPAEDGKEPRRAPRRKAAAPKGGPEPPAEGRRKE